jgi:hypothetical protein
VSKLTNGEKRHYHKLTLPKRFVKHVHKQGYDLYVLTERSAQHAPCAHCAFRYSSCGAGHECSALTNYVKMDSVFARRERDKGRKELV